MLIIFTIQAFVTFFTIIDPLGLVPVVIGLTAYQSDVQPSSLFLRWWVASCLIVWGLASTPLMWLVVLYSSLSPSICSLDVHPAPEKHKLRQKKRRHARISVFSRSPSR